MTERELLEKILQTVESHSDDIKDIKTHISHIDAHLDGIDSRLDGMESRMNDMESHMIRIDSRLDGMESRMNGMELRMDGMELHMGHIDSRLNGMESRTDGMAVQLDENTQLIKALRHSQEHMLTKLDGLETTTAKTETLEKVQTSIDWLHGKCNTLNARLFAQESQTDTLLHRAK